jgi:hypothetical protein
LAVERVEARFETNIDKTMTLVVVVGVHKPNGARWKDGEKSRSGMQMLKMVLVLSLVVVVTGKTRVAVCSRISSSVLVHRMKMAKIREW